MALNATNVSVTMVAFNTNDIDDIGRRWKSWRAYLEDFFDLKGVNNDADRLVQLRVLGGQDLGDKIRETFPTERSYTVVADALTAEFTPPTTVTSSEALFRRLYQFEGESFDSFTARVKKEAIKCEFPANSGDVSHQLFAGRSSAKYREKYLDRQYELGRRLTRDEAILLGKREEVKEQELHAGRTEHAQRVNMVHDTASVEAELRAEITAARTEWANQRSTATATSTQP